jgi:hypothetical protein
MLRIKFYLVFRIIFLYSKEKMLPKNLKGKTAF